MTSSDEVETPRTDAAWDTGSKAEVYRVSCDLEKELAALKAARVRVGRSPDLRALLVEADEYIDRLLEADPSAPAYPHEGEELHARIATALADSAPKERSHE